MFINRIMNFLEGISGLSAGRGRRQHPDVSFLDFRVGVGIAGSMETPTIVKPGSVLRIDLAETLVDSPSNDPFASFDFAAMQPMPRLPLYKALRAVEAAAADDRIAGICLRPNGGGGFEGTALVEELRAAIADFKRSGKFVVAYNEYYTQGDYYLASVADSVYMQPGGRSVVGTLDERDVLQGAFRQARLSRPRCSARVMQVQERRGALRAERHVRSQPPPDAGAGRIGGGVRSWRP